MAFRDMRRITERKVETRVGKVLKNREEAKLAAQMDFAIRDFFSDYVVHSDIAVLNMRFIKELHASHGHGPSNCFQEALKATALKSKVNKEGGEELTVMADEAYGRALNLLTKALQNSTECVQDPALGAACLIGLCEFISGSTPEGSNILTATHHHRGRVSLLQLRGTGQFHSPVGKCLFGFLVAMITLKCIIFRQWPPKMENEWLVLCGIKQPTLEIEKISFRTAEFCFDAHVLFDSATHDRAWEASLFNLVQVANDIDIDYQRWIDKYSQSDSWGYRTCSSPLGSTSLDYNVHTYQDLWVGGIWLSCFCKRAHLHQVLLRCLSLLESVSPTRERPLEMDHCKATMRNMASSICASVPFMLGIVDSEGALIRQPERNALGGYLLIYPLHVARWSVEQGSMKDVWIVSVQNAISTQMGIRSAAKIAAKTRDVQWKLF
ncbi:hypothetical protein K402DRAFT_390714 [Aulographum hederae CBS 113979]|uniref:Uncharacterized protein n=1 Tax=Aulographum hederae CBS 113979 TaxID=1176131 RepID=A0A6G1H9K7_9PEZI|nr:hypothetical protein K402DRAFT_390714 [Aulographum hederae CBS 113979]